MKFGETTFKQSNVNYFFLHENRWVDVHFSIMEPTKDDAKVIEAFGKSLQYKKKS